MNKTRILIFLVFLFTGAAVLATAQKHDTASIAQAPEFSYTLTPEQAGQWAKLVEFEKAQAERHAQAISAAVNTPVGELSKDVHAAVQSTWLAVNLARSQKNERLAQLRADHGCPDCVIADGKLTKPRLP
jgi:hypothetical protein